MLSVNFGSVFMILLRAAVRKIRINRGLAYLYTKENEYEASYIEALFRQICPGDVVWDVGANIGVFTTLFAQHEAVSAVIAFEPNANTFSKLQQNLNKYEGKVSCKNFGLGIDDESSSLHIGCDDVEATSSLLAATSGSNKHTAFVEIKRAGTALDLENCSKPDVVKIDVEGYELMVVLGLMALPRAQRPRIIAVEVHFGLFSLSDQLFAPLSICSLLKSCGYVIEWCDPSHFIATQKNAK